MGGSTKSTSSTSYPDWVNDVGKSLGPYISQTGAKIANQGFEAYTGDRVADFVSDQTDAFGKLRNLIAGAPQLGPEVLGMVRSGANAPAQSIDAWGVMDESSPVGAIDSYINPYYDKAIAPALAKIQEAADTQRKRIGAGATTAGAYGDARHGILEAQLGQDTSEAMGATAYKGFADAFDKAIQARTSDLTRFQGADAANASLGETALQRLFQGAGGLEAGAQSDQQRMLQLISSLLQTGGTQQANDQTELNAQFEEFMRRIGYDKDVLQTLTAAFGSTPKPSTTTTTQPNNTGLGLAGSLGGALISAI